MLTRILPLTYMKSMVCFARAIHSPFHELKSTPFPPEEYGLIETNPKLMRPHINPKGTRLRLPKIDKFLLARAGLVDIPILPHSCYFAVEKDGALFHIYNASRFVISLLLRY